MGTLGSEMFPAELARAVERIAHVDRLYLFALRGTPLSSQSLVQVYEPDKPPIAHETYMRHYLPTDPVHRVMETADPGLGMVQIRVQPRDITAAGYRRKLEDAGILERISYLHCGRQGGQCMTVARKAGSGPFDEGELQLLGSFAKLLMPLVRRRVPHRRHADAGCAGDRGNRKPIRPPLPGADPPRATGMRPCRRRHDR